MIVNDILLGILSSIFRVIAVSWWIILPLGLLFIFWDLWKYYVYVSYLRGQKWVLLEFRVPAEIERTPKAMEQVFASFYQIYSFGLKLKEKYWDGKLLEDFISCEIVGQGGNVHFYIRTPAQYRNLVESAMYAQYPGIEIYEVEDYRTLWPRTLPNKVYDLAGSDYQTIKNHAYPIRTYEYFEEPKEEKRLDPIGSLMEVMSGLKDDEALWVQLFVRPADPSWKDDAQAVVDKLALRKKPEASGGLPEMIFRFFRNLIIAPIEHPTWEEEKKKDDRGSSLLLLTPGERDVLEAVEKKISQIGFETNIRFVYLDRKDAFTYLNVGATMATFNQLNTLDMNGFMPKVKTLTMTPAGYKAPWSFLFANIKAIKRRIVWFRKRDLWDNYMKMRWSRGKRSILNVEELATFYHFPSTAVHAPGVRRLGTKKGGPPASLPTE